jgi:hypothetical protein
VLLWGRALLLSGVALLSGTVAHAAAHGVLPGVPVLAGLLAVGTALAAPLLRRPAGTGRLVTMLVLGQAGVHLALTLLGGHEGDEPAGAGPAWLHHLAEDLTGAHAWMALAHAGAAAVVGLWLAVGERSLWALLRYAGRLVPPRPRPLPVVPGRPVAALAPPPVRPVLHVLSRTVRRRGPPASPRTAT